MDMDFAAMDMDFAAKIKPSNGKCPKPQCCLALLCGAAQVWSAACPGGPAPGTVCLMDRPSHGLCP